MKKLISVVGLLLLAGCSTQKQPQSEPPYVKQNYSESDPAAKLSVSQFANVVKSIYPAYQISHSSDGGEVKFLPNDVKADTKFVPNNNWYSIKIIKEPNTENWKGLVVEVLNKESFEQSKTVAAKDCQKIFGNIDNRVPAVLYDLENHLNQGSKTSISSHQYGYTFQLDASHYKEGYPVTCMVNI
ncbi:hypothetical protein PGK01_00150 [Acinetobacter baumannii]|nr:hypothetical protein [Acinetobacter baumannii]MDA4922097.1 hypothetical protein [Acinetobacter baumannii]HEO1844499.1 hypothetical protein [Acinetobacter baumannii]